MIAYVTEIKELSIYNVFNFVCILNENSEGIHAPTEIIEG